jgi:hypothetical protein
MAVDVITDHERAGRDAVPGRLINHGVTITRGVCWADGSNFVFRSTEFDVLGEADDPQTALNIFVESMYDHLESLYELVRQDEATDHEFQEFLTLSERYFEATRRHEAERERRAPLHFLRRRTSHRVWRSERASSSAMSHA